MPTAIKKNFEVKNGLQVKSLQIGTNEVVSLIDSASTAAIVRQPTIAKEITNKGGATSKIYNSAAALPASGNNSGDFAYVGPTNRLYLWNGAGWYAIALINTAPGISGPNANYALDSNLVPLQVTLISTDPEELPITFSAIGSDSSNRFIDIIQDSSITTITTKERKALAIGDSDGGAFSITFKATDGTFIAPYTSSFTLEFPETYAWFAGGEVQRFQSSDIYQSDEFGIDVALSYRAQYGIVGAWKEDADATSTTSTSYDQGSAYIFHRASKAIALAQQAKLIAGDNHQQDAFGYSVDINKTGTYAVVGAKSASHAASNTTGGAAYIYRRSGTTWSQIAKVVDPSPANGAWFGVSVAISNDGDRVVVGSYKKTSNTGTAFVYKIGSTYDISGIPGSFLSASDSHSSINSQPVDIGFNANGTKMYILGKSATQSVYQYSLSTAYDTSTWTYDNVSFALNSQVLNPVGLHFSTDGTKMFVSGDTGAATASESGVWQYTLSTAFDLSTASYSNVMLDVNSQDATITGMTMNPAGTKMVLVGSSGNDVYGYNLSTAFDLSTASYASEVYDFGTQETTAQNVVFNGDGTKMFICGKSSDDIHVYNLSTAYDVSSSTFSFTVYTSEYSSYAGIGAAGALSSVTGIFFNPTGTKFYLLDTDRDRVYQFSAEGYALEATIQRANPGTNEYYGWSVDMNGAGDKVVVGAYGKSKAYVWERSGTSWTEQQILTGSDITANNTSDRYGKSVAISEDGTTILVGAEYKNNSGVYRAGQAYAYTESSGTWSQQSILQQADPVAYDYMGNKASLSADGNIAVLAASNASSTKGQIIIFTRTGTEWTFTGKRVASNSGSSDYFASGASISSDGRYILAGAYQEDTTASNAGSAYLLKAPVSQFPHPWSTGGQSAIIPAADKSGERFGYSVAMEQYGNKAAIGAPYATEIVASGVAYVYENSGTSEPSLNSMEFDHDTGVGFNSGSFPGGTISSGSMSRPYGFAFKSDGTKVYVVDDNATGVYQFSLSTPFDVSATSITYDNVTFSLSSTASSTPSSIQFKTDGTKMYILDESPDNIYEYNLSTAWDLSTASYNSVNLNTSSVEGFPKGIAFKPDGTKMYVTGSQNDSVFQYTLSTAWDLSTASYSSGNSFSVNSQDAEPVDVVFDSTGIKMFVLGYSSDTIYGYKLSTAWDVTTALYDNESFAVGSGGVNETNPMSIQLGINDSKLFCLGLNRKMIIRFSLGTAVPFNEVSKLSPSDGQVNDRFGTSIALSLDGSRIAVGAYEEDPENRSNSGSVYIYNEKTVYDGTAWRNNESFDMETTGQTREDNDRFGYSVDIDGDYLISGMPYGGTSVSGNNGAGTAAIFVKVNGKYTFQTELTGQWTNGTDLSGGGRTVAISGTRAYVGAPNYDSQKGRVAVYTRSGTTWTHQANITGASASINFGQALMADGDTAIIGAPTDDTGGTNEGRAFIYTGNNTLQATLVADDAQPNDYFGYSVSIHGDLAVVGAPGDQPSGAGSFNSEAQGAAYVFERSGTTWTQKAKLTAFAGGTNNLGAAVNRNDFGWCVDCFEGTTTNTIVVSARLRNNGNKGYIYVFTGSGTSYSGQHRFGATNNGNDDYFGSAQAECGALRIDKTPANNGDIIAIGAYQDDDNSKTNSGSVEVWKRTTDADPYISGGKAWASQQKFYQFGYTFSTSYKGPLANSYFGHAVAIQNSNLVVGAYGYGGNINNAGAIYTFSGVGWVQDSKTFIHTGSSQNFGQSVDLNSDGTIVAVGAPNEAYETTGAGAVYVMKREVNYNVMDMTHTNFTTVTSANADTTDMAFNNDGTKLYHTGTQTHKVVEYDLSTAYDVSTKTYNNINFLPSAGNWNTGIRWKPDGKKIFVLSHTSNGGGTATVHRYDVSTSWDLSTVTATADQTYDARSHVQKSMGFTFKPDGTRMFISDDQGNDVNQYNLSTAWDLTTAAFVTQVSVSSQESSPSGIEFNADGKVLYMAGQNGDKIYKYNLSTAYDISTMGYGSDYISVSSQTPQPGGIKFKPDGSKLFLACVSSNGVDTYDTSGLGYSQISKPSRSLLHSAGSTTNSNQNMGWDVAMNSSATRMIAGARNDSQTTTQAGAAYIFSGDGTGSFTAETKLRPPSSPSPSYSYFGHSVDITEDGNTVVVGAYHDNTATTDAGAAYIYNRMAPEYYAVESAAHLGFYNLQSGGNSNMTDIAWNSDGTKFFVTTYSSDYVNEFSAGIPYDMSTKTYIREFDVSGQTNYPTGMTFNNDGTKMFITHSTSSGGGTNGLFQYNLTTAFDTSTASYANIALSNAYTGTNARGVKFKPDGTKMFISDDQGNNIRQFTLSTPFDLSTTSSYDSSTNLSVVGQDSYVRGHAFNSDGTKLYVIGQQYDRVYIYNLSTAYDVSTGSYTNSYKSTSSQTSEPNGITFNPDGSKMYIACSQSEGVDEYSTLKQDWDSGYKIYSPVPVAYDYFGSSVAISGDGKVVTVGASKDDDQATDAGALYVFHKGEPAITNNGTGTNYVNGSGTGVGYFHVKTLYASNATSNMQLTMGEDRAQALEISKTGEYIIAGAYKKNGGRAYIYRNA